MYETMSELNLDFLSNCDQLQLPDINPGMGFQETIPDIFNEVSVSSQMSAYFSSGPGSQENLTSMPFSEELTLGNPGLSNSHQYTRQDQEHLYQLGWESIGVPSTTTSPDQRDCAPVNAIPQCYEPQQFYTNNYVNCLKRRSVGQQCDTTHDFETAFQTDGTKPKRKRVQNARQRKAANVRERKRMVHLNDAFDDLKTRVPAFAYEKRLSRMETLKLAMSYISFMTQLLDGKKTNEISLRDNGLNSLSLAELARVKTSLSLSTSYVSDGTESFESS